MTETKANVVKYAANHGHLENSTILICKGGSQSYGTNTPDSDLDVRGVYFAAPEEYLGFKKYQDCVESKNPLDCSLFELKKFLGLAADVNPNILEMLWHDESNYIFMSDIGRELVDARQLFLSKKAKHTFGGYARGQLARLNGHYQWLISPMDHKPTREEYGLLGVPKLANNQLDAAMNLIKKKLEDWTPDFGELGPAGRIAMSEKLTETILEITAADKTMLAERALGFSDSFIDLVEKERAYRGALQRWDSYLDWKANRNVKRAQLEAILGYDTKHAMHLVRLLLMAEEILTGKGVIVKRPDAEYLLAIRNGSHTYPQLVELVDSLVKKMEDAYLTSKLPEASDREAINKLCVKVLQKYLSRKKNDNDSEW